MRRHVLVLMVLAACGDLSPDDPNMISWDAPPRFAEVEVKVSLDYATRPLVDTPVAFIDRDGGYIVRTDVDGIARGQLPIAVAVVRRNPGDLPTFYAMVDVQDGDKVHLGPRITPWEPSAAAACNQVDFTATFPNVPVHGITEISLRRDVPSRGYAHGSGALVGSTVVHTLTGVGGDTAVLQMSATGPDGAKQYVSEWIDGCRAAYELDLITMMPWISQPTVDVHRVVRVPLLGGSLDGDVLTTFLRPTDGSSLGWHVISQPGRDIPIPLLPGELAVHNPTGVLVPEVVELDDYELVEGWHAARQVVTARKDAEETETAGPRELGRLRRSYRIH